LLQGTILTNYLSGHVYNHQGTLKRERKQESESGKERREGRKVRGQLIRGERDYLEIEREINWRGRNLIEEKKGTEKERKKKETKEKIKEERKEKEEVGVDTPKRQTSRQLCNRSEQCQTCRHF